MDPPMQIYSRSQPDAAKKHPYACQKSQPAQVFRMSLPIRSESYAPHHENNPRVGDSLRAGGFLRIDGNLFTHGSENNDVYND